MHEEWKGGGRSYTHRGTRKTEEERRGTDEMCLCRLRVMKERGAGGEGQDVNRSSQERKEEQEEEEK